MRRSKYLPDFLLLTHAGLGMIVAFFPQLVFPWVLVVFLLGVYFALTGSTRSTYYVAAYLAGIELLGRMSSAGLPHEFIKYAITAIFVLGLLVSRTKISLLFGIFMALLLPAVLLTDGGSFEDTRQLISGNLSGPVCLGVSAIYFFNRPLDVNTVRRIFLNLMYPLAAILGFMIIRTPDLDAIEFGFQSNFVTSIYGPNQMSSILGLGILVIGLAYFMGLRLFASHLVAFGFLGMLLFRGLLTFSRGGMLTPAVLLVMILFYLSWKMGIVRSGLRVFFTALALFVLGYGAFHYTNEITDNALYGRYTGVRNGRQVEDIDKFTSGRTIIMVMDWQIFKDNWLWGVGPGMGKFYRVDYGYRVEVAAHNEFTRLLAEHGLLGLVALIILVTAPISRFFQSKKIGERILIIALIGFCFVFMTHAATRIAAPCLLYGLAFVRVFSTSPDTSPNHGFVPRQYVVETR